MRGAGMGGGGMGMRRSDLMASDEDLGKAFDWRLMKRLIGYMAPFKRKAALGVTAMVVYQVANNIQVTIQGAAIDAVINGNEIPTDDHGRFLLREPPHILDGAIPAGLSDDLGRTACALPGGRRHVQHIVRLSLSFSSTATRPAASCPACRTT
jgi:hypothetical protein